MVCEHVITGRSSPFHSEEPDDDPGLILCSACNEISRPLENVEGFSPVCVLCAREWGWAVANNGKT